MQILIGFLWLLIELAIVGFIGWIITAAIGLLPFIPDGIKAIVKQIVYFIVIIVCLILLIGWLASMAGSVGNPTWPPFFHRYN